MGFWPFGGGKKRRTSHGEDQGRNTLLEKERTDPRPRLKTSAPQEFAAMGRSQSTRDEAPRRLSKQRHPSHQGNVPRSVTMPVTGPAPESRAKRRGSAVEHGLYSHNPMSQPSIGPDDFTTLPQAPTLLAKRKGNDPTLLRRKSSKRKAEDYAREREIRAMSSPVPGLKRPSTYSGSGQLRQGTKQVPGDLNLRLQRPASEMSLPVPETVQESKDLTNHASFKIGILAALSPRPTLTYVANPRSSAGKQPARIKPLIQQAIEEEDVSSKKRIDELADDLDAGGLRELMERDRRRHERKKVAERDRLQRKLQRKTDRQREEEMPGRQVNESSTGPVRLSLEDSERRGRRPRGNGAEASEAAMRRIPSRGSKRADPFIGPDSGKARPYQHIRNPFDDEKDVDLMHDPFAHEEDEGPPVPGRSPLRTVSSVEVKRDQKPSPATTISPPTSPIQRPTDRQSLSQTSGLARELTPDIPEHGQLDRRASDQSSQHFSSWTNFFKRGNRRKPCTTERGRSTPSEFSNTSRESFARKPQPPPVVVPRTFRRSESSGVPQRTMSKFREDLPEFPISPPDSRVQSPEIMTGPQAGLGQQSVRQPRLSHSGTLDERSLATSSSNPALDRGTAEGRHTQAMDIDVGSGAASGMAMSQSLASVDSEGSWLSGKPVKRLSGGMSQPPRQSQSSPPPPSIPGAFEADENDLADDEYLNRLTPGPSGQRDSITSGGRKASSTVIDLERERQQSPLPEVPPVPSSQGGDETWHEGVGRQVTVVRQPNRAKSKEGLLKESGTETPGGSQRSSSVEEDDGADDGDLPEGETAGAELRETPLLRARSVEYKGHARHISAGSARLLDIRRSSTQSETTSRSPSLPHIATTSVPQEQPAAPKEP
ncbi:uncharacterized protein Z518_02950 [Rhinocladiella mackenziei CBS 650.93]|uniref:Rhinocladiella mackenziei CBS 650.93 unplaced genomic scaffold supercont1.2, whole genome shotgun sequence n=1 Tax=Rhinocladiella mackenziei CBS 650.93 TaxID=1442369 RepID=A0A0D2IQP3_9EURO|nr:uncharacterized protein Z518_02950 [Rhinocladiella mackenziei CBS 650.93]KIX08294.1 hypothetical protein Z518_02950 [Rhinocladiella mackenziei CBS 650.93]